MGVEPTSTGLRPVAVPSGSSVVTVPLPGIEPGTDAQRWSLDLRALRVPVRHTPRTMLFSSPPRNRTPSCRIEVCRAVQHTRRP